MSETSDNRRIRELTESRAALERRLGELSTENDRLREVRDRLFSDHKEERDRRQRMEGLLDEASALIPALIEESGSHSIRLRAAMWKQTEAALRGNRA